MGLIIFIDINGQRGHQAGELSAFMTVADVERIVLCGVPGLLRGWMDTLQRHGATTTAVVESITCGDRRDETVVRLGARALELCLTEPSQKQHHWMLISRRAGFQVLVEQLNTLGVSQAQWAPCANNDLFRNLLGSCDSEGQAIVLFAQRLLATNGRPVPVGDLANRLMSFNPRLADPGYRKNLFGERKFSSLFRRLGLVVKDNRVYPVRDRLSST